MADEAASVVRIACQYNHFVLIQVPVELFVFLVFYPIDNILANREK